MGTTVLTNLKTIVKYIYVWGTKGVLQSKRKEKLELFCFTNYI